MSLPLNVNSKKHGPIEVTEDATHFLVRIHYEDRDRAKQIVGRQWDGKRSAWVYAKDLPTYNALVEEFQNDADHFDIRKPKTKRPIGMRPPTEAVDTDEFEDQLLEELRSLGGIGESQGKLHGELDQIRVMLQSLADVAASQSRTLEEVRDTQEQGTQVLVNFERSTQAAANTEPVEVLPDRLDLSKQKEIELLEQALVQIACLMADEQESFCNWIHKYKPLRDPTRFVIRTHEFLKKQLGRLVGDEDSRTTFSKLVEKARDQQIIFSDPHDPADKPIAVLFALNGQRNCFGHPDFNQWEEWSRSILYLLNLPLIWEKIQIKVEDINE